MPCCSLCAAPCVLCCFHAYPDTALPAGVGKGRQIAACVKQAHRQGVKRFLWITVSNDLKFDSERDLKDVDCDLMVYPKVGCFLCGLCCMRDRPEVCCLLCGPWHTPACFVIGCLLHALCCMLPLQVACLLCGMYSSACPKAGCMLHDWLRACWLGRTVLLGGS